MLKTWMHVDLTTATPPTLSPVYLQLDVQFCPSPVTALGIVLSK
jgi:hypothetical protein